MGDRKQLIFIVAMVIVLGLAGYVWYPRLFSKKPPIRVRQQEPPLVVYEAPPPKPPVEAPPPAKAKPPAPETAKAAKETPKAAKEPSGESLPPAPTAARRYGLEFPPFVTTVETEEYERRLKEAGLPTLRTTTDVDGGLYALIVGPLPSAAKASEAMTELRAKPAVPSSPTEGEGGFVFSDGPYVLREVVQRAMEIREKGYGVRIVRAEGRAPLYVIRTAARLDTAQANKLSSHYRELGFPNSVV